MKKFSDYDATQTYAKSERLPAGAYVIKIKAVKYSEGKNGAGDRVELMFDIVEGDYKDFYKKNYDAQQSEDKKWKGKGVVYVPVDDGSERDGYTKRAFKSFIEAVEKSNPGYRWDWNEQSLKDKLVGGIFRDTYTVIEGKQICYTELGSFDAVEKVRAGKTFSLNPKYKNGAKAGGIEPVSTPESFVSVPAGIDEEVPW